MRLWVISGLLFLGSGVMAQHGSTNVVNPYTGRQDAEAGAKLYRAQCAGCHGFDGNGTAAGPTLASGLFRHGGSDEALFHSINKGIPGTSMPAFNFNGRQIWQLVTHVRSFAITHSAVHTRGDKNAGAAVFRANCSGCHAVAGSGGLLGPDLTSVGNRLSAPDLRTAIADPNASVPNVYWRINVITTGGKKIEGTRLNDDTFSVQIRDLNGRLMSVSKADVRSLELVRASQMPSFTGKLDETQLNNLVAYLATLKGEQ
jgi:putative heme-binding domain-containing protein